MTLKQQIQDALAAANGDRTTGVLTFDEVTELIWKVLKFSGGGYEEFCRIASSWGYD